MTTTTTATSSNTRKELALYYNEVWDRSVVVVKNPDSNPKPEDRDKPVEARKHPDYKPGEFKPYLDGEKRHTTEELERLYEEDPNRNIGLIAGIGKEPLLALDFDGPDAIARFESKKAYMSEELRNLLENTAVDITGRKNGAGRHLLFKYVRPDGESEKIPVKAQELVIWKKPSNSPDEKEQEIQIMDQGHQIIMTNSRHPNGNYYTRANDKLPAPITDKVMIELINVLMSDDNGKSIIVVDSWRKKNHDNNNNVCREGFHLKTTATIADSNKIACVVENKGVILSIAEGRLINTFKEYYASGSRQDLWIGISGLFRRNGIPLLDAINSSRKICEEMPEDEINKRVDLVTKTYTDKYVVEVASWNWLEDFIKRRNPEMDSKDLEKKVELKKQQILAALLEFKLELIKRDNPWVLINQNPETYIVARRSDSDFDITDNNDNTNTKIRRVQLLEVKRARVNVGGNIDNAGRGDIRDLDFGEIMIDAVPAKGMEIVEDPIFGGTKYRVSWEYVDKTTNEVRHTNIEKEPLRSKEELEKFLKTETTWVRKTQKLTEVVGSVIDAYKNKGCKLVHYKREVEPTGFFYYDGGIWENKLNLDLPGHNSWWDDPESVKKTAKTAVEVIEEMQEKFFNGAQGRDAIRFAHYLSFHIVAPFDYVRKQLGITERWGWVPRSDMSGASGAGKTAYGILGCLMYGVDKDQYIISKRSFRSEARLIEVLGQTTMPITLEEPDFLANVNDPKVEDMISTLKDSVSKSSAFRLTADHRRILENYLAPILLSHNSAPIVEDGMSRRFINDEFEEIDKKEVLDSLELMKQVEDYKAYVSDNAEKIKSIGKFVSMFVRAHPQVLEKPWQDVSWTLLQSMWLYAEKGEDGPPEWLKKNLLSKEAAAVGLSSAQTSSEVADYYREQLLIGIQSYVNDEFSKHGMSFEREEGIPSGMAGIESRLTWLAETTRLPGIILDRKENAIFFSAGLKQVLVRKYRVDERAFPSLTRFASYLGFEHKVRKIKDTMNGGWKTVRVAYVEIPKLIRQFNNICNKETICA